MLFMLQEDVFNNEAHKILVLVNFVEEKYLGKIAWPL